MATCVPFIEARKPIQSSNNTRHKAYQYSIGLYNDMIDLYKYSIGLYNDMIDLYKDYIIT